MPPSPTPSIHPQRAADLARRTERAADEWRTGANRLHTLLLDAGEIPHAARHLAEAAEELSDLAGGLRTVLARVGAMEAGLGPFDAGLVLWRGLHDVDGVSDEGAAAAATEAWDAYRRGDLDVFFQINQRFMSDPRYAAAVAARVDVVALVDELGTYHDRLPGADAQPDDRRDAAARAGLFQTLATASLVDELPFTFGEVQAELERRPHDGQPLHANQVALLFRPEGIVWGGGFVSDAARSFVLPRNDRVTAGVADTESWVWWPSTHTGPSVDARPLVLAQLAHHPDEASALVAETDPARLFGEGAYYDDRGRAAGALLVAATRVDALRGPQAADRVFTWLGAATAPALQPQVQARLGQVVAPYLGAFRSDHARSAGAAYVADPLLGLDTTVGKRVLALTAANADTARDLERLGLVWLAREADTLVDDRLRSGREYAGQGLAELGDTWGLVAAALHSGEVARAVTVDDRSRQTNEQMSMVLSLLTVPFRAVSNVAAFGLAAAGSRVINDNVPQTHALQGTSEKSLEAFTDRLVRLKTLVLARLWASNQESEVFVDPPPLTDDGTVSLDALVAWQRGDDAAGDSPQAWMAQMGDAYAMANG